MRIRVWMDGSTCASLTMPKDLTLLTQELFHASFHHPLTMTLEWYLEAQPTKMHYP